MDILCVPEAEATADSMPSPAGLGLLDGGSTEASGGFLNNVEVQRLLNRGVHGGKDALWRAIDILYQQGGAALAMPIAFATAMVMRHRLPPSSPAWHAIYTGMTSQGGHVAQDQDPAVAQILRVALYLALIDRLGDDDDIVPDGSGLSAALSKAAVKDMHRVWGAMSLGDILPTLTHKLREAIGGFDNTAHMVMVLTLLALENEYSDWSPRLVAGLECVPETVFDAIQDYLRQVGVPQFSDATWEDMKAVFTCTPLARHARHASSWRHLMWTRDDEIDRKALVRHIGHGIPLWAWRAVNARLAWLLMCGEGARATQSASVYRRATRRQQNSVPSVLADCTFDSLIDVALVEQDWDDDRHRYTLLDVYKRLWSAVDDANVQSEVLDLMLDERDPVASTAKGWEEEGALRDLLTQRLWSDKPAEQLLAATRLLYTHKIMSVAAMLPTDDDALVSDFLAIYENKCGGHHPISNSGADTSEQRDHQDNPVCVLAQVIAANISGDASHYTTQSLIKVFDAAPVFPSDAHRQLIYFMHAWGRQNAETVLRQWLRDTAARVDKCRCSPSKLLNGGTAATRRVHELYQAMTGTPASTMAHRRAMLFYRALLSMASPEHLPLPRKGRARMRAFTRRGAFLMAALAPSHNSLLSDLFSSSSKRDEEYDPSEAVGLATNAILASVGYSQWLYDNYGAIEQGQLSHIEDYAFVQEVLSPQDGQMRAMLQAMIFVLAQCPDHPLECFFASPRAAAQEPPAGGDGIPKYAGEVINQIELALSDFTSQQRIQLAKTWLAWYGYRSRSLHSTDKRKLHLTRVAAIAKLIAGRDNDAVDIDELIRAAPLVLLRMPADRSSS